MSRGRAAARAAGTWLERVTAEYLAEVLGVDVTREAKHGARDLGDIHGVRTPVGRLVIECKNTVRPDLPQWWREAQTERVNADAAHAVIVHKRVGSRDPAQQWVTCDLATLASLINVSNRGADSEHQ